jgi:hypothetical protein
MALLFNNKFNIIQQYQFDDDKNSNLSHIINYFENYLESDINIIYPEYIKQLYNNTKYDTPNIDKTILDIFKNHLKKIKIPIQSLIKKEEYTINTGINKLLIKYKNKITFMNEIINIDINRYYYIFHDIILTDQLIILFIENELPDMIKQYNIKDLTLLISNISDISINDDYIWFLKLIGKIIRNNIPIITENIIIKNSYEIKIISNYILNINNIFNFLKDKITYIIMPLNDVLFEKINDIIKEENNFNEFYYLIKEFFKFYTLKNFSDTLKITIKNQISLKLTKYSKKIDEYDDIKIFKIIEILILINEYQLINTPIHLLLNIDRLYNNIIPFINYYMNDSIVFKLIDIIYNIKNIDKFIIQYHIELIKRLLSDNVNLKHESILSSLLVNKFGENINKKILKCIIDYESSISTLSKFIRLKNYSIANDSYITNDTLKIITTSYDSWNINFNNGYVDLCSNKYELIPSSGLYLLISEYNNNYRINTNNTKKYIWLLQFGEIVIEYNIFQIKLLPIQLIILELFNIKESINISEIKSSNIFKNYQFDYLLNVIKSLEISGIIKNIEDTLYLSDTVYNTDLIAIYYNCLNQEIIINDSCENEIAHTRNDIICSLINSSLKKSNKNISELFNEIAQNIKLFPIDIKLIEKSLEHMIKNDYIKENNNIYEKLYY